jgi:hypothetical protein
MQTKNIKIFTQFKWTDMPVLIFKSRFFIAVLSAAILLLSSCKKTIKTQQQNILQQYFEENILSRDFVVHLAMDNGADKTAEFSGFVFQLTKNTLLEGPMTASNGLFSISGTWASNEDYSKLTINLPATSITAFTFLNREWRFTKKAIPIMELAPWGSTEAKVLHMQRQ